MTRTTLRMAAESERRPDPVDETRAIPQAEIERLLSRRDVPLREKTLWRMLYETGARASEILALNVEVLDLERRRAPIRSAAAAATTKPRISLYRPQSTETAPSPPRTDSKNPENGPTVVTKSGNGPSLLARRELNCHRTTTDSTKWLRPHRSNLFGPHKDRLRRCSGPTPIGHWQRGAGLCQASCKMFWPHRGGAERSWSWPSGATATWRGGPKNTSRKQTTLSPGPANQARGERVVVARGSLRTNSLAVPQKDCR
jgi:Phage integrase family